MGQPASIRRLLAKTGLCGALAVLTAAAGPQTTTRGRYRFDVIQTLADLPIRYDVTAVKFPFAPVAMTKADLEENTRYGVIQADGRKVDTAPDFNTMPYWVYAEYRDRSARGRCRYALVDGLHPDEYKPLPATGDIDVQYAEEATAVLRDCGHGYEVVSREVYGSFFDEPFESAYLKGANEPPVAKGAARGLARDYVNRLIVAFGGKAALRRRFEEAQSRQAGHPFLVGMPILKAEFVARGVVDAGP